MNKLLLVLRFIVLAPINLILIIFNGFSYLCELMSKGFFFYFKKFFDLLYKFFPKCSFFSKLSNHYKKRQGQPEVFLLLILYFISFVSIYNLVLFPEVKEQSNDKYINSVIVSNDDSVSSDDNIVLDDDNSLNNSFKSTTYFGWGYRDFMDMALNSVDFSELKSKNSDTVAWLNVDSTYINYPVVQTSDNQYYLKHSFIKEKKQSGWPFMDYRNHKDMSDKNTIFYGHNLLNKNSFGSLSFLFEDSWKKSSNRKIVVLTENKQYIYEIFSIYYSDPVTNYLQINFSDDNSYLTFLNNIKEKSLVDLEVQFTVNDRIITLSTCTEDNQGRKVVHAKLIYEGNR